ncbi:MAG: LysR family transcriptional regulator [Pelovirga sp.]
MDTRYLKTLITVVEAGSFSKAATVLHLTQSAVSQRIKFLEETYGAPLFDRSGPIPVLTEAGRTVLESAQRMLDIEASLLGRLKENDNRSKISFCCTPTFGTVYLPNLLNLFMAESTTPLDFQFLFYSPDRVVSGVAKKEFDAGVVEHCDDIDLGPFQAYALPEDELIFVSAPHLNLPGPELELDVLFAHRLLARKEGCSSRQLVTRGLQQQGARLEAFAGLVVSDDLNLTCRTVLSGGGISFMSRSLVQEYLADGRMIGHHVKGFPHRRCRTIIMEKKRAGEPLLRSLTRCIFKAMELSPPF